MKLTIHSITNYWSPVFLYINAVDDNNLNAIETKYIQIKTAAKSQTTPRVGNFSCVR